MSDQGSEFSDFSEVLTPTSSSSGVLVERLTALSIDNGSSDRGSDGNGPDDDGKDWCDSVSWPKRLPKDPKPAYSPFWNKFPGFVADPSAPINQEFARLAVKMHWTKQSQVYDQRRREAFHEEFEFHYGVNGSSLDNWHSLCDTVGVPRPSSITQCKKALKKEKINLVNLVNVPRTGEPLKKFKNLHLLRKYTTGNRIFPKDAAKENSVLKGLLFHIF